MIILWLYSSLHLERSQSAFQRIYVKNNWNSLFCVWKCSAGQPIGRLQAQYNVARGWDF